MRIIYGNRFKITVVLKSVENNHKFWRSIIFQQDFSTRKQNRGSQENEIVEQDMPFSEDWER